MKLLTLGSILNPDIIDDAEPVTSSSFLTLGNVLGGHRGFDLNSPKAKAFLTASDDGTRFSLGGLPTAKEAWEMSVWIHQCIHTIASVSARMKVSLRRNEKTEIKQHPLLDLMYSPNPVMSRFELFYITGAWMNLFGDAFWYMDNGTITEGRATGSRKPQFIWPIAPFDVEPEPDRTSKTPKLNGWRITLANGFQFIADPLDVIQFRYPNPFDRWRGAAPLISAKLATANDLEAVRHNLKFFRNGARPSGVLETPEEVNDVQAKQMLERFEKRHREPHRPALLDMGTKYHETQISNAEMEFAAARKMNREDIAGAFKVPPIELGIMDHASFANTREQSAVFMRGAIIPLLDLESDAINTQGLRDEYKTGGISAFFDMRNVEALKRDQKADADVAAAYRGMGVPFNQINEKMQLGFDRFDGDDIPMISTTLVVLADVIDPPEPEPAPAPPGAPGEEVTNGIIEDVVRGVLLPETTTYAMQVKRASRESYEKMLAKMLLVIDGDKPELKDFSESYFTKGTAEGIAQGNKLTAGSFNIDDPEAVAFVADKVIRVTKIQDYQKELIRDAVTSVIEEGGTVAELRADLVDLFNFTAGRARMIARNEIADAVSGGRFMTFESEGVTDHEWVAEQDDRTREEHSQQDGTVVALGDVFELTQCRYPHDPEGPADQTIQCRCVTLPVIADEPRSTKTTRAAHWRDSVRGWSAIKNGYAKRLKRLFNDERNACLAIVAEA